ncbi:MAG: hypothetical protein ACE5HE_05965 [Phycisphaerae bacterium]
MTPTTPLEIRVIYSASSRRGGRGKAAHTVRTTRLVRPGRRSSWAALGILNTLVAGALCYGIWWRVDSYLYLTMVMRTPVLDVDLNAFATQMFGVPPEGLMPDMPAADMPVVEGETQSLQPPHDSPEYLLRFTSGSARVIIVGSAYLWLAVSTVACCVLAFSGGASLGRGGSRALRACAAIITVGGLAILLWVAWRVWAEYGWTFRPRQLRVGMSLLVLMAACAGLVVARSARRLMRWAAVLLIAAAGVSVCGLYLGARAGAVPAEHSTLVFLAMVFAVHSLYGWILLPISSRIGR